jgi:hypothetical protein
VLARDDGTSPALGRQRIMSLRLVKAQSHFKASWAIKQALVSGKKRQRDWWSGSSIKSICLASMKP